MSGTLGVSQDQTLIQTHCIDQGAGKSSNQVLADMGPTLSTTHYGAPAVCYGISPYASNAMLSDNPNSGIYEADTSRTLDLNGGSPACNQGGVAVVQKPCAMAAGVVSKGNGEAFLMQEKHTSLSVGGGEAGQGYACVMAVDAWNGTEDECNGNLQASAAHNNHSNNVVRVSQ